MIQDYKKALEDTLLALEKALASIKINIDNLDQSYAEDECVTDILRFSNDPLGLAKYFEESTDDKRNTIIYIIKNTMSSFEEQENVINQLRNLYYLDQANLDDVYQTSLARNVISTFINSIDRNAFTSTTNAKERESLAATYDKLEYTKEYLSTFPINSSLKDVDTFMQIVNNLDISDEDKTGVLTLVFLNDLAFYQAQGLKFSPIEEEKIKNTVYPIDSKIDEVIDIEVDFSLTKATITNAFSSIIPLLNDK